MSYTGNTPKFESVEGDNIKVDGNTISSTDVDGDINLSPNGAGKVKVATQTAGDNSTAVASTGYVDSAIADIPPTDLTGYATEQYVDDAIADIPPTDLTGYATEQYVDDAIADIPAGEVATAANVGVGEGIFKEKLASEFKFKKIKAGTNISIAAGSDDLTISAAGAGGAFTEVYPILNAQSNTLLQTLTDRSKVYDFTYSVNRSFIGETSRSFELQNNTFYGSGFTNHTKAAALQTDGKVVVGGVFKNFDRQTGKNGLIRLNADNTEDTAFSANAVVNGITPRFQQQDPEDEADIRAVAVQADGKILASGFFYNYDGQTGKNFLIRLNEDGTEDTAFSANAVVNGTTPRFDNPPYAIAVQADGKILLGGVFTNYNAQVGVSRLIRLNADGTEDTAFTANAVRNGTTPKFISTVEAITVQADGKIYVGGAFTNYNAQVGRNRLIRLNADGTEDTVFSTTVVVITATLVAKFSSTVRAITIQADNKILVGGDFLNYNATGRNRLVRFNADLTEDLAFAGQAIVSGTLPKFSGPVATIAVQADGKILLGGSFLSYPTPNVTTNKNYFIRLNSDGSEDTVFSDMAVVNGIITYGSTSRMGGAPTKILVKPDGKIIIVGSIGSYNTIQFQQSFVTLNSNGSVAGNYSFYGSVTCFVVQPDGKRIYGGNFVNYNGQQGRDRLIRLQIDGTEDTTFSSNAVFNGIYAKFNGLINSIALQADGKILVGGSFTNWDSVNNVSRLIRLNANGTHDLDFTANAVRIGAAPFVYFNNTIDSIAVQADGKILIGGLFTDHGGVTGKNALIRLNANGTEDTAFTANAVRNGTVAKFISFNSRVTSTVFQPDNKILIGGNFTNYNSETGKNHLLRLNADGTEDTAFTALAVRSGTTPKFGGSVSTTPLQADGKILVGGTFTNYNSETGKNCLIRLNADGTEDTAFSANATVNGTTPKFSNLVRSVAVQADGKILAGGFFLNYNAQTGKDRLIRLNADGTEDTAFSAAVVVSGTRGRFNQSINLIKILPNNKLSILGNFFNFKTEGFLSAFSIEAQDSVIRSQIAKLQAIPNNVNEFTYSTPVVLGPEAGYPTGVTVTFNADGTIKYSSTTLDESYVRVDTITIERKQY